MTQRQHSKFSRSFESSRKLILNVTKTMLQWGRGKGTEKKAFVVRNMKLHAEVITCATQKLFSAPELQAGEHALGAAKCNTKLKV